MARIDVAVVYGSTFGDTARLAGVVARELSAQLGREVPCLDVATADVRSLRGRDLLVVGSSTWHAGELQADWEDVHDELAAASWHGTRVALFGTGDPHGYPGTFADALDTLARAFAGGGAELVGAWPAPADAPFGSRARRGDAFVGLALDADLPTASQDAAAQAWCRALVARAA